MALQGLFEGVGGFAFAFEVVREVGLKDVLASS